MLPGYRSISIVLRHSRLFYLYYRIIVVVGAEATIVKKDFLVFFFFFFFFSSSSSSELLYSKAENYTPFAALNSTSATFSLAKISKRAIEYILIGMLNG